MLFSHIKYILQIRPSLILRITSCVILIFCFTQSFGQNNLTNRVATTDLPLTIDNTVIGVNAAPNLNLNSNGTSGGGGTINVGGGVGNVYNINFNTHNNTMLGSNSGYTLTTSQPNNVAASTTIIGAYGGSIVNNGYFLGATFLGTYSGYSKTLGSNNKLLIDDYTNGGTFIGYKAGYSGGNLESIAIGVQSGLNGVCKNCVLIGKETGAYPNTITDYTTENTIIGTNSGRKHTGNSNVFFGNSAGSGSDIQPIFTNYCVFLGNETGRVSSGVGNVFGGGNVGTLTTGIGLNTFMGFSSGSSNSSGNTNTFLGTYAGQLNVTGERNIALGYDAGATTGTLTNTVAIGHSAKVTQNNSIILGKSVATKPRVGIGNTNPNNYLEITANSPNKSGLRFTNLKSTSTTSTFNNLNLTVDAVGNVVSVPAPVGSNPTGIDTWTKLTNGADYIIQNNSNKSVMIGNVAANKTSIDYKLYVEKGLIAAKVTSASSVNWPDYVFNKEYSLIPLEKLEKYINTNHHLPEVASAKIIEKDGVDLAEMDATLLKKIEEITLYVIDQEKLIANQQETIDKLQERVTVLKARKNQDSKDSIK
jgi:trimeric autotransporter adhesin